MKDPVYHLTSNPAFTDASTSRRQSMIVAPTNGGTGTLAAPLNNPAGGVRTKFQLQNGANVRYRFGTMGLRMMMVATLGNNTAAAAPITRCSPPWNLIFHLIENISVTINQQGTQIVNYTEHGSFAAAMTMKLLRFYSHEQLNAMDNSLFTPLPSQDDSYTLATPADSQYVVGVNNGCLARANRWFGANSHQRVITKIIPFSVLFPTMPDAVWKNMNSMDIDILWTASIDLLESANIVAAIGAPDGTRGAIQLIQCDVIEDSYVMSAPTSVAATTDKVNGEFDIIPSCYPTVTMLPYIPGGAITLPGVINPDCLAICQFARGFTNGQAGGNILTYSSLGETLLFGNSTGPATLAPTRADYPVAAGYVNPITYIRTEFGPVIYPSNAILTTQTTNAVVALDPGELHYRYLEAAGKVTKREVTPAVPLGVFKNVLPFIMLRPWGDNAYHLSREGNVLRITMQGGVASNVAVVIFQTKAFSIRPDGVVVETFS